MEIPRACFSTVIYFSSIGRERVGGLADGYACENVSFKYTWVCPFACNLSLVSRDVPLESSGHALVMAGSRSFSWQSPPHGVDILQRHWPKVLGGVCGLHRAAEASEASPI